MSYATEYEDALQLGDEAKADPSYLLEYWTTSDLESSYNRLHQQNQEDSDGPPDNPWQRLPEWRLGRLVSRVENILETSAEMAAARALVQGLLDQAVETAVEHKDCNDEDDC